MALGTRLVTTWDPPAGTPTRTVLGVDPSLTATGLCLLAPAAGLCVTATVRPSPHGSLPQRALEIAHTVRAFVGHDVRLGLLVVEHMRVYPQRRQKGDPNGLIAIAAVEGAIMGMLDWDACEMPTAHEWKGQVPKDIHHRRLRATYPWLPEGISKDAVDAAGLALWGLERYA